MKWLEDYYHIRPRNEVLVYEHTTFKNWQYNSYRILTEIFMGIISRKVFIFCSNAEENGIYNKT